MGRGAVGRLVFLFSEEKQAQETPSLPESHGRSVVEQNRPPVRPQGVPDSAGPSPGPRPLPHEAASDVLGLRKAKAGSKAPLALWPQNTVPCGVWHKQRKCVSAAPSLPLLYEAMCVLQVTDLKLVTKARKQRKFSSKNVSVMLFHL